MINTKDLDNPFIKDGSSVGVIDEETQVKILTDFIENISNQEDMPIKYQKLVIKNFWNLI